MNEQLNENNTWDTRKSNEENNRDKFDSYLFKKLKAQLDTRDKELKH